jgi:aspartate/methionine/tyrosine aminotransferase
VRPPPFELERFFAKYEFNVEYVLCGSDCESFSIEEILALDPGAGGAFKDHWLGYTESRGDPTLRHAIAGLYDTVGDDEVLVHAGAEEAIFLFMHAMLNPGDHVIVHWPCYQALMEIPRSIGCKVTLWRGREASGWAPDVDELKAAVRPNTKAIILNVPHNPTGYLMPRDEFLEVNAIARDSGTLLFVDEVYRESEHHPDDRLPAGCDLGPHAVYLGVMSKTYGLPGLRIGWVASQRKEILDRMAALKDYTTICCSAPSEFLATRALENRDILANRNLGIIRENLAKLDRFFEEHGDRFQWERPKAGSIGFPRLLEGDIEEFVAKLVGDAGVLLLPGTVFQDQENHLRLGFGRKNMPEALGRLEEYLADPPSFLP